MCSEARRRAKVNGIRMGLELVISAVRIESGPGRVCSHLFFLKTEGNRFNSHPLIYPVRNKASLLPPGRSRVWFYNNSGFRPVGRGLMPRWNF